MKPGDLITMPTTEHFQTADLDKWWYIPVEKNSCLLCVEEMDLTKEWEGYDFPEDRPVWASMVLTGLEESRIYSKLYDQLKEKFKNTGKIEGFKFLCPNGKCVWISQSDVNFLLKNDKQL